MSPLFFQIFLILFIEKKKRKDGHLPCCFSVSFFFFPSFDSRLFFIPWSHQFHSFQQHPSIGSSCFPPAVPGFLAWIERSSVHHPSSLTQNNLQKAWLGLQPSLDHFHVVLPNHGEPVSIHARGGATALQSLRERRSVKGPGAPVAEEVRIQW